MRLYVVRHAHAGSRSAWVEDDRTRPLSKKGWRQATALADRLGDVGITRLVSSPSLRCVETMRPLADRLGLVIDDDDRLAEGEDGEGALALADELCRTGSEAVALCSHGDVIPDLLWELRGIGTTFHDPLVWPKGSVWEITSSGTRWTDGRYLSPLLSLP
jgi:broad specificity phosphatase PhoE